MAVATQGSPLLEGQLTIDVRHGPAEVVLAVGGELDFATAPLLAAELAAVLRGRARRVVLDLGGLDFIDAVGIGCIAQAARRVAGRSGTLVVTRPSRPARRILELCDLDGLLC